MFAAGNSSVAAEGTIVSRYCCQRRSSRAVAPEKVAMKVANWPAISTKISRLPRASRRGAARLRIPLTDRLSNRTGPAPCAATSAAAG